MTYRQAIQIQINALQTVFDNCEGIRDAATLEEKEAWNNVRRQLPDVWGHLQKLDNSISDKRGAEPLKGTYTVVEQ